jgi:uncharacterized protein
MNGTAIPIYQGQDFYVPSFEVKVGGQPVNQKVIRDIMSVSYKDNIHEIDSFEIVINNWDAGTRAFKYSDSQIFDPGQKLMLSMGYQGALRTMVNGEITSLRPSFPAGGGSTLAVSGLNVLHHLRTQQESRVYQSVTDIQVAQEIADRLKITLDPTPGPDSPTFTYLVQDNQYDIVFLMERARQAGYDLFVEERSSGSSSESVLVYKPSTSIPRSTYQLTYGKSLIEFQPELTTANQVSKVTVRGWDNVNGVAITYTADRSEIASKGIGANAGQAQIDKSIEQRTEIVVNKPVQTTAEAQKLATELLNIIAKGLVKGTGSVPGLPDIRSGTVLMIDGLGERFSGRYFVVSTTHAIGDGGYTTQFECRREEL